LALVDNLDDDDEWDERLEFQPPNANALHKNTATMGSYHRPLEDFKICNQTLKFIRLNSGTIVSSI
jgi:hypothetical protein